MTASTDRRSAPRGGRRTDDRPGRFPVVLVADGYEGARRPTVRYLERFGFLVKEAATGQEASAILNLVTPRIVLADVMLRDRSVLTERLSRGGPRTSNIPTIALTTWEVAPATGSSARVFVKPFRLRTLLEEIRQVLRSH